MENSEKQNSFIENLLDKIQDGLAPWAREHKVAAGAIPVLALTFIGFIIAVFYYLPEPVKQFSAALTPEPEKPEKIYYSPLTGKKVKNKNAVDRQVTGIMIENSPAARPHSGMLKAGIVYEAIAEAGITRFLAIYQQSQPDLIGPVRSLRPYFVDWLAPYDAAYAHVGGSARSLQQVRSDGYKDIDQFFNPNAYYRSDDRRPPHNMYTTFDRLNELNKSKGYTKSTFKGWPRKPDAPLAEPDAGQIQVNISRSLYNSSYQWRPEQNDYLRFQGGGKHTDRETGRQLNPEVVIVMKVKQTTVQEDGQRQKIKTNGSGPAFIFQDGRAIKATWRKQGVKKPLQFFADDKQVQLNIGQTWVTAIPKERSVTWN